MSKLLLVAILATLNVAGLAPTATAARPATAPERYEMIGDSESGAPAECYTATVSTVDDDWARVARTSPAPEGCESASDEVWTYRRSSGSWDFYNHIFEPDERCDQTGFDFPSAVGADLGVCTSPPPPPPIVPRGTRLATDAERQAVLAGWTQPQCYSVAVAKKHPTWALVRVPDSSYDDCDDVADVAVALQRDGERWITRFRSAKTALSCAGTKVPAAVGATLRVCVPPVPSRKTTLTCWGKLRKVGADDWVWPRRVVAKPTRCDLPGGSNAEAVILTRIRWKSWGGNVAKGTAMSQAIHGRFVNDKLVFDKHRVTIRASRPTEQSGKRWYQRLTVNGRKARPTNPWATNPGQ